jgi:hypothetical protein
MKRVIVAALIVLACFALAIAQAPRVTPYAGIGTIASTQLTDTSNLAYLNAANQFTSNQTILAAASNSLLNVHNTQAWTGSQYDMQGAGYSVFGSIRIGGTATVREIMQQTSNAQLDIATSGGDITLSNNTTELMRMKASNGFLGVTTSSPGATISTGSGLAPVKVAAYDNGSNYYGIGVAGTGALTFGAGIASNGTPQAQLFQTGRFEIDGTFAVAMQTPATSSATCTANQFAFDTNYLYVCTATNTWKRAALATF